MKFLIICFERESLQRPFGIKICSQERAPHRNDKDLRQFRPNAVGKQRGVAED